ncbi:UBXN1 [Cordylochernes scorpioides]|uniref:UBXN1 n=1 Tax=Cordylochernes scorpioides TaxID=51811 RepID=A0ABY6K7U6_9ARAC|nr:UBXN1 [Cordylochernes scorpioides]
MEEQEMRRIMEQKRREKLEDKMARQRVLEDIQRDRLARQEKFGGAPAAAAPAPTPVVETAPQPESSTSSKKYEECKIQTLVQTFSPQEELAAVRLYVQLHRTDGSESFGLMTTYPRRVFTDEDMNTPLQALGLVPSAVIFVVKK